MEELPTYEQAACSKDPAKAKIRVFELVAPYVNVRDAAKLCRVSAQLCSIYAPRIWKDPISAARELGIGHGNEDKWWEDFLIRIVREQITPLVRPSALNLVATMDCRGFCTGGVQETTGLGASPNITESLEQLLLACCNLHCLILDGHADLKPRNLANYLVKRTGQSDDGSLRRISLLSLANCQVSLQPQFFDGGWAEKLLYLDLSNTGGWARHLLAKSQSFVNVNLPSLRIMKLRGKGLDAITAGSVLKEFACQLWSVDLSFNNLRDDTIEVLANFGVRCDAPVRLRNNGHFKTEGKLRPADASTGVFFVEESAWSAKFSDPDRYLADPFIYSVEDPQEGGVAPERHARLTGTEPLRGDSVKDVLCVLSGRTGEPSHETLDLPGRVPQPGGMTHLHLNELDVSSESVQSLLARSSGWIEHFECDRARFLSSGISNEKWLSKAPWLSSSTVLYGFPGAAYLFRPVISSNLRVLKIHHSIITNTPTLVSETTRALENIWVAENHLRERIDLALPQTYVPDMNPRLHSLTISKVPRYSTGIIIERLIKFLKLAAAQERGVEYTKAQITHHRGPPVLLGLRHIRLEFEPDAMDELISLESESDVDEAMEAFNFFSESAWGPSSSPLRRRTTISNVSSPPAAAEDEVGGLDPRTERRLTDFPFDQKLIDKETIMHLIHDERGKRRIRLWIGPGVLSPANPPAVNEYMQIMVKAWRGRFCGGVIPSTPCHVAAGVPHGSYIVGWAWDRIMKPNREIPRPSAAQLRGMKDVLEEIKKFRLTSREEYANLVRDGEEKGSQHQYWKGKLDFVLPQGRADYWR